MKKRVLTIGEGWPTVKLVFGNNADLDRVMNALDSAIVVDTAYADSKQHHYMKADEVEYSVSRQVILPIMPVDTPDEPEVDESAQDEVDQVE